MAPQWSIAESEITFVNMHIYRSLLKTAGTAKKERFCSKKQPQQTGFMFINTAIFYVPKHLDYHVYVNLEILQTQLYRYT